MNLLVPCIVILFHQSATRASQENGIQQGRYIRCLITTLITLQKVSSTRCFLMRYQNPSEMFMLKALVWFQESNCVLISLTKKQRYLN